MTRLQQLTGLRDQLLRCRDDVYAACDKAGRGRDTVKIVLATKTRSIQEISLAVSLGFRDLGENRAQELLAKAEDVNAASASGDCPPTWHFIGKLQRNKVREVLRFASVVQSVDQFKLAQALSHELSMARCPAHKPLEMLIQVNTSGEATKGGVSTERVAELAQSIAELPHLRIIGLMTLAAPSNNESDTRGEFRRLRDAAAEVVSSGIDQTKVSMNVLSMGMSSDFVAAIDEGSTMIRLGSAAFGPR